MNFALLLVILSAISGIICLLDKLFFAKHRATEKPGRIIEYSYSFFPVFFLVLLLRTFLAEPFRIPSGSLEPTLLVGDFVVVNKFIYGLRLPVVENKIVSITNPKIGDIAVFRWPANPRYDYIKRVIGTPGDEISYHNKILTINGKDVPQDFIDYTIDESSGQVVAKYLENLHGIKHYIYARPNVVGQDFKVTVPSGQYFMMGDNRDDSADSRFWGFVPQQYLRGKALLVWMSWNSKNVSIRWSRIGHIIH